MLATPIEPLLYMVEVRTNDWAESVHFYVTVLGLTPLVDDPARKFTLLKAGNGRLAVKEGIQRGRDAQRLIFEVYDAASERRRLIQQGVEVSDVLESNEGYQEIRLRDPDGTPIHLFSSRSSYAD
jgi:catechol 2,3-dioxygenase-like lactoylglutathione lyase family enzyme